MDVATFVTSLNPWLLFCLVILTCVLFAEFGSLIAQNRIKKGIKEPEAPIGTAVGAMLGLLAFMLGFTFSITAERFGSRKELLIQQANAIGTCYVRTSMIPEKQKQAIRKLLKEYVNVLLAINYSTPDQVVRSVARTERLHVQIWRYTATLAKEDMDSEIRTFFSTSVNDVMAIARERKTVALVFRIPGVLWTALFFLTAVSMFSIGYQTGTYGKRRILDMPLLAIAFALVVVLIADMDSSGTRRLKVSVQPLLDVKELMKEDIP
jgi:hypothetical protein